MYRPWRSAFRGMPQRPFVQRWTATPRGPRPTLPGVNSRYFGSSTQPIPVREPPRNFHPPRAFAPSNPSFGQGPPAFGGYRSYSCQANVPRPGLGGPRRFAPPIRQGVCPPPNASSSRPHSPAPQAPPPTEPTMGLMPSTVAGGLGPERPNQGLRKHRHHPYANPASVGRSPSVQQLTKSSAGPRPRAAVIFDFDECLMRMHVWGKYRNAPLGAIPVVDGMFADLPFLQWLIPALHQAGVVLAIATFGRRDVVTKFLEHALGTPLPYFSQISTPATHSVREGSSALGDKNTQLRALSAELGVELSDILFFDDSAFNVAQADTLQVTSVVAAPFCEAVWQQCDGAGWLAARGIVLQGSSNPEAAADPEAAEALVAVPSSEPVVEETLPSGGDDPVS
eukprot:GGOE01000358.1.p1 GENE.GGOE01000358.1~~GGOE01000358.1.p1  ORF type:complete len:440 (-),score=49.78 GGOE01000358.1:154-1338(-)